MAETKSISNDVKKASSEAQAAGLDFTSSVSEDVQQFANDVGRHGRKAAGGLHDDVEALSREVARIMASLRKLAAQGTGEAMDEAHDKLDELVADTAKIATATRNSARSAVSQVEAVITANPLASIMIALGFGVALRHLMRR